MKALLLDLQGVLFEDGTPIFGAVKAVEAARAAGRILRFVTNTATRHPAAILEDLRAMGFDVEEGELFTAPLAARSFLLRQHWRPHCLVHPAIRSLFDDLAGSSGPGTEPDCVVLGDARDELSYANCRLPGMHRQVPGCRPCPAPRGGCLDQEHCRMAERELMESGPPPSQFGRTAFTVRLRCRR